MSPLDPITVTMDPIPPMAASFIPIDNPTAKIRGTCGEPTGSTPTPFQPSTQATMPTTATTGTTGWVVVEKLGAVPMKGVLSVGPDGSPSFTPEPGTVGDVENGR